MSTYLIISRDESKHHTGFCALGHEIHLGRTILLDMLHNNYINDNCVIVTVNLDRAFLYSKIFKNIISYNDFIKKNVDYTDVIEIWPFVVSITSELNENYVNMFEKKCNYPIKKILYEKFENNYQDLIANIDFPSIKDIDLIEKKYFVIHSRMIENKLSNNNVELNLLHLNQIVNKINEKYLYDYNIIIFTVNNSDALLDLKSRNNNIKIINKLDIYASLMNHNNCEAVISELSGAGEFAQYCHNKKIYLYSNSYEIESNKPIKVSMLQNANNTLHYNWNEHGTTDAILYKFNNIDLLLQNI